MGKEQSYLPERKISAPMTELKNKISRGVIIMFLKEGWTKFLGVVGTMILARILCPSDFGYIATIYAVLNFSMIFIGKGVVVALIRHQDVDDGLLAGALLVCTGLGVVMSLMVFGFASGLASFFHAPFLAKILRVVAPALFFRSLAVVPAAIVQKRMHFLRGTLPRLVSEVVFWCVTIVLACRGLGALSFAWAMVCSSCVNMVINWSVAALSLKLYFTRGKLVGLWRPGMVVILIELLEYLTVNMDGIIIMKFLGPIPLGFYFLAYRFSNYFYQEICTALSGVFFPVFSSLQDASLIRHYFLKATFYIGLFIFPFYFIASLFSREIVLLVYGQQWGPVAIPLGILCFAGIVKGLCVGGVNKDVLYARGRLKVFLNLKIVVAGLNALAVFWGLSHGIAGVAAAVTCAGFVSGICMVLGVSRVVSIPWREYILNLKAPWVASLIMGGVVLLLERCVPSGRYNFIGVMLLGAGVYIGMLQARGVFLWRESMDILLAVRKFRDR